MQTKFTVYRHRPHPKKFYLKKIQSSEFMFLIQHVDRKQAHVCNCTESQAQRLLVLWRRNSFCGEQQPLSCSLVSYFGRPKRQFRRSTERNESWQVWDDSYRTIA